MAFIETRLSDLVAYNFRVIPAYRTNVVPMDNGKEFREITRSRAKREFHAIYNKFTTATYALLLACFHACAGSGLSFRLRDWTDYQVVGGSLGTTPGANSNPVQLVKVYTMGPQSRTRTIVKPVAGTVTVYQADGGGTPVAKAGTIDTTTGLFTPTTAWTASRALTADFEFDTPVRFKDDEFPSTYEDFNAITADVTLIEDFL